MLLKRFGNKCYIELKILSFIQSLLSKFSNFLQDHPVSQITWSMCSSTLLNQPFLSLALFNIWRVSSQNGLYPVWSIWDIWDLSCWEYQEHNKKICNTFDHNFKNIPVYIMRKVSLGRYYFVLYDGALTLKMSKMALNPFCDKTHLFYISLSFYLCLVLLLCLFISCSVDSQKGAIAVQRLLW